MCVIEWVSGLDISNTFGDSLLLLFHWFDKSFLCVLWPKQYTWEYTEISKAKSSTSTNPQGTCRNRRQILIRDHSGIRLSEIDISIFSVMMCQLSEWKRWTPWARENPSWKCVPMERANFNVLMSPFWLAHLSFSFTKTVNVVLWGFLDFLDFCGPLNFF